MNLNQQFFWVNHKQTVKQEIANGYIWSPKANQDGRRNQTYDNLLKVRPGDIVFSFAHGQISAVGIASSVAMASARPVEFGTVGQSWGAEGWKVEVRFERLGKPIRPKAYMEQIAPLLPAKYSPIKSDGNGNQGCYLAQLSEELGRLLLTLCDQPYLVVESQDFDQVQRDINDIKHEKALSDTDKQQLIKARVGQGIFRQEVMRLEPKCRVTGIQMPALLIASHIKPWAVSSNAERLDPFNGLMLARHVDVLFDQGWLSFNDQGDMLVSPELEQDILLKLGLQVKNVGSFAPQSCGYLHWHREHVFRRYI